MPRVVITDATIEATSGYGTNEYAPLHTYQITDRMPDFGIVWLGVYPAPVLRRLQPSAEHFVRIVELRAASSHASVGGGR